MKDINADVRGFGLATDHFRPVVVGSAVVFLIVFAFFRGGGRFVGAQTGNVFANPAPITIADSGPGSPNPSNINVTGLSGTVTDVNVTLNGFSHTFPDDVGILLVSPSGRQLVIQSDVGGGTDAVNLTYTIDDQAAAGIPDAGPMPPNNGSVKPSSVGDDESFGPPAPVPPYNQPAPAGTATLNGIFSGDTPNGEWKLFVFDAYTGDAGTISGGWSIQISVTGAPAPTPTPTQTPTPTTTPTPTPTPSPTPSPTPNTPQGANVSVVAPTGNATVAFSVVSLAGTTTFTAFDPSSAGVLPAGYTILNNAPAYDITTTAGVSPPIDVCFLVSAINDPTEFAGVRILHEESGQLVDRTILAPDSPAPDFGSRRVCARVGSLSRFVTARTTPTFSVSGRVSTPTGLGLRNAVVSLTDSLGVRLTATTSSFGIYSFNNVRSGEYLIGVSSKRYRFATQTVSVSGNLTNVNFVGLE